MKSKKYLWIVAIIVILTIIDQIIKGQICNHLYNSSMNVINGVLNLTYVENKGIAFGFEIGSRIVLIIINLLIIAILANFIICKKEQIDKLILTSLSLILAGGTSNLFDRIIRGFVVDYIDINLLIKFAVFNFADMCVVIGIIIIAIKIMIDTLKQEQKGNNERI